MLNQYNPFKENRAEQMKDLWKYYVPFPGLDEAGKPVVVEGGRGSGKTMFFQCNSWRQVLSKLRKNDQSCSRLFDVNGFIGIYYRVDTTFVSSMCHRDDSNWSAIFETYFCICIIQEILELMNVIALDISIEEIQLVKFVNEYSKRFNSTSVVDSIESFRCETDKYLDIIEDYINGVDSQTHINLRWITAHRLIFDVCESFNKLFRREVIFKIFVDEYETLQLYQQKIINTLIKHSTLPVIFNIGLRPHGMKTNETISDTEIIESPHDYELLTLGIDSSTYSDILKQICAKRISLGKEQGKIPKEASEDIEFYLGEYKFDDELARILSSNITPSYLNNLRKIMQDYGEKQKIPSKDLKKYITVLCDEAPILNSRLHYALLCKKTHYTPSLRDLYESYITKNNRYNDWMHNRRFALLFLLCKEFKREKMYYGFEVFAALSSNIVRYFLELCEQSFRIAFLDNYNWDKMIPFVTQSDAAKYVSEYKVMDIGGYEPYGKELRIFIQYLGQIFYKLHTAELNTLGEPEPNHFNTKNLSLPENLKELIDSAIMWNVLQENEPTKRKQSKLSAETIDYYINKIYVPYFGISYRNQRKIQLDVTLLKQLFSGDEEVAKSAFREYFKLTQEQSDEYEKTSPQISLFDFAHGGEL